MFGDAQSDNYFDVVVVDTGKRSSVTRGTKSVLRDAEQYKRAKYDERVRRMGATFTPLACSICGTLATESTQTLAAVVRKVQQSKWERTDADSLHRLKLQMAITKATSLCLRGRSRHTPCATHAATDEAAEEEEEGGRREAEDARSALVELDVEGY